MRRIPDPASIATMQWVSQLLGRKVGASTGTNLYGVLELATEMQARGESGSLVTLLCDAGERYLDSYYCDAWVAEKIGDLRPYQDALSHFTQTGQLPTGQIE